MESFVVKFLEIFHDTIKFLNILQVAAIWAAHWIGRFIVIAVFVFSIFAISYNLSVIFEFPLVSDDHWSIKVISLFNDPKSWIATTAVVATTVAMGHFRTLDLNIDKAKLESEDRIDNKNKA